MAASCSSGLSDTMCGAIQTTVSPYIHTLAVEPPIDRTLAVLSAAFWDTLVDALMSVHRSLTRALAVTLSVSAASVASSSSPLPLRVVLITLRSSVGRTVMARGQERENSKERRQHVAKNVWLKRRVCTDAHVYLAARIRRRRPRSCSFSPPFTEEIQPQLEMA